MVSYDCRACAACCSDAGDGRVLVSDHDLVRWRRESRRDILDALVPGHFSQPALPARPDGRCAFLGHAGRARDCSIYDTRGASCRAVEPGGVQCLAYRRARGLDD